MKKKDMKEWKQKIHLEADKLELRKEAYVNKEDEQRELKKCIKEC